MEFRIFVRGVNVKKLNVSIALLLVLSVLMILSACAEKQATLIDSSPSAAGQQDAVSQGKAEAGSDVKTAAPSETDLFESERIFFDFDKYNLKPEALEILAKKAEWLQAHPEISIRIEGHCDERGTDEYNLALGQRRAETAMSCLVSLGISKTRITTVSYGESQPVAPGHDEESWTQNRRDEFKVSK